MHLSPGQTSLSSRLEPVRTALSRTAWFWSDVFLPFLFTRLALIFTALFATGNYQPNPTYQEYAQRGWLHSKYFLIDIWSHWDAGYYLQLVKSGYTFSGDLTQSMSNMAFFPLYPYLVKAITWLVWGWTGNKVGDSLILAVGIVLSNLLFLAAMALLYRLATRRLGLGPAAAKRATALIILFPVGFIFSSFYTESLFFFLAVAGFSAALDRRWFWAGVCAGLVTLTRIQGIVVAFALFLVYLQQREWKLSALRADVLWLGLSPLLLAAHLFNLAQLTGSFFAPFVAQSAWGRNQYGFFEGLRLQLGGPVLDVFKIDAGLALVFLGFSIALLRRWPVKAFGVFSLLMTIAPISTGMLISESRFLLVIFPVFLLLGDLLENQWSYDLARGLGFALQVIYFAGWVNYYWIT